MRTALTFVLVVSVIACGKLADESSGHGNNGGLAPGGPNGSGSGSGSLSSSSSSSSGGYGSSSGTLIGDDDDDVSSPRPKRTDLALQSLADLRCKGWSDCGLSGPHIFVGMWGDQATCVATKSDQLATDLATRGITVTQAQIDACAARLALTPCVSGIPECEFTGQLATGDTCSTDAQCQSGTCTFPTGDTSKECGKCQARAAAGEACSYDFDCAIGLACNAVSKKCMSPLPASASCVAAEEMCGPGLTCLGGLCTERIPVGSACEYRGHIKYGYYDDCAAGSWCRSDTKVCTAFDKVTQTAGIGEACEDLKLPCRASNCDPATKKCVARPPTTTKPPVCN